MRRGDIIVNPYVPKMYNGKLNPMYATIYLGGNESLDYLGRKHPWAEKVYKNDKWKVIGHVDFRLYEIINKAVEAEE